MANQKNVTTTIDQKVIIAQFANVTWPNSENEWAVSGFCWALSNCDGIFSQQQVVKWPLHDIDKNMWILLLISYYTKTSISSTVLEFVHRKYGPKNFLTWLPLQLISYNLHTVSHGSFSSHYCWCVSVRHVGVSTWSLCRVWWRNTASPEWHREHWGSASARPSSSSVVRRPSAQQRILMVVE